MNGTMSDNGNRTPVPDLRHIEAWVFDLDNTLYPASCALFGQIDRRMSAFISDLLGVDVDEARRIQKAYYRDHGTTLRGLMVIHGVAPEEFLEYVHDIDHSPLAPSPALEAALARLEGRKIVFTNGSTEHAAKVMGRLGVAGHFEGVFDIVAANYLPKPEPAAYEALVRQHGLDPAATALFEDIPRNLAPAAAMGMTTVWVRNDDEWALVDAEEHYIDHVADDLATWLEGVIVSRGRG